MTNETIVSEFARIFVLAPRLAELSLQEALKVHGYEVFITKQAAPEHPDPYHRFPVETGERVLARL